MPSLEGNVSLLEDCGVCDGMSGGPVCLSWRSVVFAVSFVGANMSFLAIDNNLDALKI